MTNKDEGRAAEALVVEDLPPVRRGLKAIVESAFPGIVVREAQDLRSGREALARCGNLRLALVDLGLPDGPGLELLRELREARPDTLRVVTTIYDDDEHLFAAMAAGASGYILKEQPADRIEEHLRKLEEGIPALSPPIARRLLSYFHAAPALPSTPPRTEPRPALTPRETEVLSLVARGLRRREVGELLKISENTVASFIKDIYRKLDICSRAEAALEASRLGLL